MFLLFMAITISPFFEPVFEDSTIDDWELEVERIEAKRINPNYASPDELAQLPFASDALVASIVAERNIRKFKDIKDFQERLGLSDQFIDILSPYLSFEPPKMRYLSLRGKLQVPQKDWYSSLWGSVGRLDFGASLKDSIHYGLIRLKLGKSDGDITFGKLRLGKRILLQNPFPLKFYRPSYFGRYSLGITYRWLSGFVNDKELGFYLKGRYFGALVEIEQWKLKEFSVLSFWNRGHVVGGTVIGMRNDKAELKLISSGGNNDFEFYTALKIPDLHADFDLKMRPRHLPLVASLEMDGAWKLKLAYKIAPRTWLLGMVRRSENQTGARLEVKMHRGVGICVEHRKDTTGKSSDLIYAQVRMRHLNLRIYTFNLNGIRLTSYERGGFRFVPSESGSRLLISYQDYAKNFSWRFNLGLTQYLGHEKISLDFGLKVWYRYEKIGED